MKLLLIEDEELAVKKIQKTLMALDPNLEIVGTTDSIASSVEWLQNNPKPDLILMDIELADGQSFEIFNRFEVTSPVIFTTSYDEYALKAFKVNSIDYLLKPIQKDDLELALEKFKKLKNSYASATDGSVNVNAIMKQLQSKLYPNQDFRKRFLVKHAQKLVSIDIEQIAYFYSDDRLNFFKTFDDKKYLVEYKIDEIEEMVNPSQFFRISRSYIVSIKSIDQINYYFGNRLILGLKPKNEKEAFVSREKVSDFKVWMGK